jgi:transposase InsO family protein
LNPFAERWVRTARELCVDRMVVFGEGSLRRALAEVETLYNQERPHQGLGNTIILPEFDEPPKQGTIECRSRLGGMLNYYHRKAA